VSRCAPGVSEINHNMAVTNDGNESFTGKVAFVTGAGSGIGRATALAFARAGASVVVADIVEQASQETARLIEEQGGRALAVKCDVTLAEDVKTALDETVEAFVRLDFAFNNAGLEQKNAATAEIEEESGAGLWTLTFAAPFFV
jgi:NAD(P)-dependent dehydrogenase (short-subunit alcohol dehydrogenase family)